MQTYHRSLSKNFQTCGRHKTKKQMFSLKNIKKYSKWNNITGSLSRLTKGVTVPLLLLQLFSESGFTSDYSRTFFSIIYCGQSAGKQSVRLNAGMWSYPFPKAILLSEGFVCCFLLSLVCYKFMERSENRTQCSVSVVIPSELVDWRGAQLAHTLSTL